MKKTVFISLLTLVGIAQADTENLIKSSHISTDTQNTYFTKHTSIFGSSLDNITAENVSSWLSSNMASVEEAGFDPQSVYCSTLSGGAWNIDPKIMVGSEEGVYSFSMTNRQRPGGSIVGIATTVDSDLNMVTGLTFSLAVASSGSAGSSSLTLVYQTEENVWESVVTKFTATDNQTAMVSLTLDEGKTLASSQIYAVVATRQGYGTSLTGNISLTATTASVPEPATATLSLLAMGALALRRRRA